MADDRAQQILLDREIAGLDALETPRAERTGLAARVWAALWPKAAAIAVLLGAWQLVSMSGWRPTYVFPGPATVLKQLGELATTAAFAKAIGITMQRAVTGFALAALIGTLLGIGVSRSAILRRTFGSLITGLQSMPSIAWFPFAILLFKLSEGAILFVVVLGATPSIANGLVTGVDHIPPLMLRVGRTLGARGLTAYRHVILPAAFPGYVAGLKQGWAFAWRSLMAGELIVIIATRPSLGAQLQFARELSDAPTLMALMIVVLVIGTAVDGLLFGALERRIRHRRGLVEIS